MKLVIKKSKLGGRGSFAPKRIIKGSHILSFYGELIDLDEVDRRIAAGKERADDPLQVDDLMFLDIDDDSFYINHNCGPNAFLRGYAELVAQKDIEEGQEITFDYSATVGKNIDWWMNCICGSKNCRKRIGNVSTIPENQLNKYYQAGGLQDYIRKQLGL